MADEAITRALADCLDALREGPGALEDRLSRYQAMRGELEELLHIVQMIPRLPPDLQPDRHGVERTRFRILSPADGPPSQGRTGHDPSLT
jgi:hypothetical protein